MLRCTVAHAPPYIPHSCVGMSRNDVECWHAALRGWSRGVMGGGLSISSTHAFNLIDGLSRRRARTAHAHAPTDGGARHLRDDGPARRARPQNTPQLHFITVYTILRMSRRPRLPRLPRPPPTQGPTRAIRLPRSSAPQPLTLYTFPLLYGLKINIDVFSFIRYRNRNNTHTHTHNETEVAGRESGPGAS